MPELSMFNAWSPTLPKGGKRNEIIPKTEKALEIINKPLRTNPEVKTRRTRLPRRRQGPGVGRGLWPRVRLALAWSFFLQRAPRRGVVLRRRRLGPMNGKWGGRLEPGIVI